jgi:hypothetical protein
VIPMELTTLLQSLTGQARAAMSLDEAGGA